MKILLYSSLFSPSVGGLETQMRALAAELSAQGDEVRVVTRTAGEDMDQGFQVIRNPGAREWLRLVKWCDVHMHACVSLRALWPLAFVRRPLVISHQTWYRRHSGHRAVQDWLKCQVSRRAFNIAPSAAIAEDLGTASVIIPNSYDSRTFRCMNSGTREYELVFLGRLVSDKGCDLVLDALSMLAKQGLHPRLSIIGAGPEEPALRTQLATLGLESQVQFKGVLQGEALADELNQHTMIVVPSRWNEPFGIVALEGIACGCVPIVSSGGGLRDAIGDCGVVFESGTSSALAQEIARVLTSPDLLQSYRQAAAGHLERHQDAVVAGQYREILRRACAD